MSTVSKGRGSSLNVWEILTGCIRIRGGITDEALVSNLAATLFEKLKGYEAILSRQKYMAGDVSVDTLQKTLRRSLDCA